MTTKYTNDLAEETTKLERLLAAREDLEVQIAKQKRRVAALYELADTNEDAPPPAGLVDGLTDACRVVFMSFDKPLLPIEVRDKVQALGIPPQSNLLASVHTTIRRMRQAGEIKEVFEPQAGGSAVAAYKWAGETAVARLQRISRERDARAAQKLGTHKVTGKND